MLLLYTFFLNTSQSFSLLPATQRLQETLTFQSPPQEGLYPHYFYNFTVNLKYSLLLSILIPSVKQKNEYFSFCPHYAIKENGFILQKNNHSLIIFFTFYNVIITHHFCLFLISP